jgi:hypothetical protein
LKGSTRVYQRESIFLCIPPTSAGDSGLMPAIDSGDVHRGASVTCTSLLPPGVQRFFRLFSSSQWRSIWLLRGWLLMVGVEQLIHYQVTPLARLVDAMCLSLAATSISAHFPSGNAPTTRVSRRFNGVLPVRVLDLG